MIDPRTAERLARDVLASYEAAETAVLEAIAKRLAAGEGAALEAIERRLLAGGIIPDDYAWQRRKLAEIRTLRRQVESIVARLGRETPEQVLSALTEARRLGLADAKAELAKVGIGAEFEVAVDRRTVVALARATTSALEQTHLRILRTADDVYRQAVSAATRPLLAGARTRLQAAQRVLDIFADRGVTGFVDRAGRSWNLASYAEMATRSASGQAAVQGSLDGYLAADRDLVIVSDSPEECPLCRPWEGKVLSITGKTPGYPTIAEARNAGLFHPGCTHGTTAYIPGLTRKKPDTDNPQGYADRQEQRRLERGVRQWKRREAVALDEQARTATRAKVREWQGKLRQHVDRTGMQRLRYREQIKSAV